MENGLKHPKKNSYYMPKLCSSTFDSIIKDVHLSKPNRHSSSSSSSSSSFNDPSSPRVTCMGKVKKDTAFSYFSSHYKFNSVPATTRTSTRRNLKENYSRKYSKECDSVMLRKVVEEKSAQGYKCRLTMPEVNISQMDPPLPVIKKIKDLAFDREHVNLWKRRSEFASKSLQLSHIHIPDQVFCSPYESGKETRARLGTFNQ